MAKRKKRSASKKTARRRTTADANAEETASGTPSLPQVHPPTATFRFWLPPRRCWRLV